MDAKNIIFKEAGTVTLGVDYYTSLIEKITKTDFQLEILKKIVDEDRYTMSKHIKRLFGWEEQESNEEE